MTTVWLLDVDGVINASQPRWSEPPRTGYAFAGDREWKLRWSPSLVRRIKQIHESRLANVTWCSTWNVSAHEVEKLLSLPALPRAFINDDKFNVALAKHAAAFGVVARGDRLIWTDDQEVPSHGEIFDALTLYPGRTLLIRPDARHGLRAADLDRIEKFCAEGDVTRDT